jgi:hypothetical protein
MSRDLEGERNFQSSRSIKGIGEYVNQLSDRQLVNKDCAVALTGFYLR